MAAAAAAAKKKTRRSSAGGARRSSATGESEVFDYDTSNSISDEDETEADDSATDEELGDSFSSNNKKSPRNRTPPGTGSKEAPAANMNIDMDYDDYGGGDDGFYGDFDGGAGGASPFSASGESPLRASTGSTSSASKRRVSFGEGVVDNAPVSSSSSKVVSRITPKTPDRRKGGKGQAKSAFTAPYDGITSPEGETTPGGMSVISTPGSNEFPRGRAIPDESYMEDGEGSDDELVDTDDEGAEQSFLQSATKRRAEDGDYDDDDGDDDDDDGYGRRSKRATKGKRFQYWKNERPVYNQGQIVGLLTADPTPKKKAKPGANAGKAGALRKARPTATGYEVDSEEMPPVRLPSDIQYLDSGEDEELMVWDDPNDAIKTLKVVCNKERLPPPSELPITAKRPKGKSGVGSASQFFAVPEIAGLMSGWISGFVVLPAGAIKDAEGVGECSQVFFISDCQDESIELGIADPKEEEWNDEKAQRLVLSKGDSFFVPPGNIYRLENHSTVKDCTIFWTIVQPIKSNSATDAMAIDGTDVDVDADANA